MYKKLPTELQTQLDTPKPRADNTPLQSIRQDGLAKIELVYHLCPGPDRRLETLCTVDDVATELNVSEETARKKLAKLVDKGILHVSEEQAYTYSISPDHWNVIDPPEATKLLEDGGIPMTEDPPSSIESTDQKGYALSGSGYAQADTDGRSVTPGSKQPLVDASDGRLTAPFAASVALLVLGVVDAAIIPTTGLIVTVSWLAYELAKLPNYTPHDMLRKLTRQTVGTF